MRFKEGFTLVENLTSLLLVALVLTGGMALYHNSSELLQLVSHKRMATELANTRMEDLQREALYPTPISGGTSEIWVGKLNANMVTTVRTLESTSSSSYKQVDVDVQWTEAGNTSPRDLHLMTYIAQ